VDRRSAFRLDIRRHPNGQGRVLVPVEEEQEALRAAAQVLIKDGLKSAAKYLN
jgi:hypothetical protein